MVRPADVAALMQPTKAEATSAGESASPKPATRHAVRIVCHVAPASGRSRFVEEAIIFLVDATDDGDACRRVGQALSGLVSR